MVKIDLKNERVQRLIEATKKTIEYQILDCFECIINPLYIGEVKDGKYLINVCFLGKENKHCIPFGLYITTNIEISEEDYKKWIKEVNNKK